MTDPHRHHLLSVYAEAAGRSEVPKSYHLWAALSLVSATLADRVWIEKWAPGSKLVPNLYVFLLGPSANGKGVAIGRATDLAVQLPRLYTHHGPITAQGLFTALGKRGRDESGPPPGKIFVIQEELGMSVGKGPQAEDFIKHLTGLYEAGRAYPLTKRTATDGDTKIQNHCITFLGGSILEWLVESVPRSAIEGGFVGRTVCIYEDYHLDVRFTVPEFPANYQELDAHIGLRLQRLCYLAGPIVKTADFKDAEHEWYMTRPVPTEAAMIPTWKREHDLILKVVCLLVACEPFVDDHGPRLVAERKHWLQALSLARGATAALPTVLRFASQTPQTALLDITRNNIKNARRIHHSVLMRRLSSRGIDKRLLAQHIETLVDERRVRVIPGPPREYLWMTRSPMPPPDETPPTEDANEDT